jgi:hypothetical protein
MHSLEYCVLLAAIAQGATVQERGWIPLRAPEIPEVPPVRPDSFSPGSVSSGGRFGGDVVGAGSSGATIGGLVAEPASTTLFQPGFYEKNKELIKKAVESVYDVLDFLQNVISLAEPDDDDDHDDTDKWQPTGTLPASIRPTQVANTTDGASNSTVNYILTQNNVTYTFLSDPRLMSKDVVAELASYRLSAYQELFTQQEYSMLKVDPICFYANIESIYLNASSSEVADASITASPTQSLGRRQSTDDENTTCEDVGIPGVSPVCTTASDSSQWTSSHASDISSLWAYELPDQLRSAHFATPTAASGEVTATATSTTSCVGLDGGEGPVTRYRELKTRDVESATASGGSIGESVSAGIRIGGGSLLACIVSAASFGVSML